MITITQSHFSHHARTPVNASTVAEIQAARSREGSFSSSLSNFYQTFTFLDWWTLLQHSVIDRTPTTQDSRTSVLKRSRVSLTGRETMRTSD